MRISALTKRYVTAEVILVDAGGRADLSGDTAQMAFPLSEQVPTVWNAASWEVDAVSNPKRYLTRCLVGPAAGGGGVVLAAGTYDEWVKVTHGAEVAVEQVREPDGRPTKLVVY